MNQDDCCLMLSGLPMDNTIEGGNNEFSLLRKRTSAVLREVKDPGRYFSVAALWQPAPCRINSVIKGKREKENIATR